MWLPAAVRQVGESVRSLRALLATALTEAQEGLGPETGDMTLTDLHPRALVQRYLLDEPVDAPAPAPDPAATWNGTKRQGAPLGSDETAPWDADAT